MTLERFLEQGASPRLVAAVVRHLAEQVQRFESVRMIGSIVPTRKRQRFFERGARRIVGAARVLNRSQHVLQLGAHGRCFAQSGDRARLRVAQELAERNLIAVGPHGWIRRLEQIDQHAHDLLRRVAFVLRGAALLLQHPRLSGGALPIAITLAMKTADAVTASRFRPIRREIEHARGFFERQAAEDAAFDDAAGAGVEAGEAFERDVDGQHFLRFDIAEERQIHVGLERGHHFPPPRFRRVRART